MVTVGILASDSGAEREILRISGGRLASVGILRTGADDF
jgi:hypothetical protein